LYDFLYELEESDNIKREAQKISVETQGPTGQPGSKKMRMDEPQVKFGSEKQVNTPSIKKFGVGGSDVQSFHRQSVMTEKFSFSAPGKLNLSFEGSGKRLMKSDGFASGVQDDNEAIPAATYQPSSEGEDSDNNSDFEGEVNKVMSGKQSQYEGLAIQQ